ncbi:MAG: PQQ-binding-like beta-propeller repeat protein [Bacteroidales bacterium]|jgi:outer membrane protein assembly factor BamB|nr:PQQ-binding-like beta-propeller repeat protein [Bacteroidales bacterium]
MKKQLIFISLIFSFLFLSCQNNINVDPAKQWPSYRGYFASGILDQANLPEFWDVEKSINIKWTADIPGLGLSSPVIWGDKLFITTAISTDDNTGLKPGIYGDISPVNDTSAHQWKVYCYDKNNGEMLWERTSYIGVPKIKRHPKSTHANCSVATNGEQIIAFFGSEGLYCYDMKGQLLWQKDFGILKSVFFRAESAEWEFSSSPIIYKNVVIIQNDVLENSFVAAFDAKTGKQLWKKERDEYPGWCTPNIYRNGGKDIVVLNGYKHRGGYDFETGEEIWRMSGGGDIQIPTPIIGKDLIYFNSAHGRSSPILAIKKNAKGDITLKKEESSNEFVQWSIPKGGAYMQTMILYDGLLYNCKWNGNIFCYDAITGEEIYKEKLGDVKSFSASPVIADGKLYISDEEGMVYIVQTSRDFKLLASYPLGDICMTSPAITENIIFFRTQKKLIAISQSEE